MMDDSFGSALIDLVRTAHTTIEHVTPVEFNERHRYLPPGTSPQPGFIDYSLFPFWIEPLNCFDPLHPAREVNILKGAQVGFTTAVLEAVLLYYIGHLKTLPAMYITADRELSKGRMENNILPMLNESGFAGNIRSADVGNARKTGKTKDFLQWDGGGWLTFTGAQNAAKMRQASVPLMVKDELDGWKPEVGTGGREGSPDKLTDSRLKSYWQSRKILRGSTPLLFPSMTHEAYIRGDQRKYHVLCKACNFPQEIGMRVVNKETGNEGGFHWETEEGSLVLESVRWACQECGHEHHEADKSYLLSADNGAHWHPTAKPKEPHIYSYHAPAFLSPYGFRPWSDCVVDFLDGYDPEKKQTKSVKKFQTYYNNTRGWPFKPQGRKIRFRKASAHRRPNYQLGQVPNIFAEKYARTKILFLTCQVDVHKSNLAVAVMGWTRDARCFVIDYWRWERETNDEDCTDGAHAVWGRLRELIETGTYTADDGTQYRLLLTLIDAGYANATVISFCGDYASGVYPIHGRGRMGKNADKKEFAVYETKQGTNGYMISVDHYKDRLEPALQREWIEEQGDQREYHFNAPIDLPDKAIAELTVETLDEKSDARGNVWYEWHRPPNARNELWDLLVYGHAAVEIFAAEVCIEVWEMEEVRWDEFWDWAQSAAGAQVLGRTDPPPG